MIGVVVGRRSAAEVADEVVSFLLPDLITMSSFFFSPNASHSEYSLWGLCAPNLSEGERAGQNSSRQHQVPFTSRNTKTVPPTRVKCYLSHVVTHETLFALLLTTHF